MKRELSNPIRQLNPLDREQRAYLEGQLRSFRRMIPWESDTTILRRAPLAVRKAEKLTRSYFKAARKNNERREARLEAFAAKVRVEMLFGDPRKALRMIEGFKP